MRHGKRRKGQKREARSSAAPAPPAASAGAAGPLEAAQAQAGRVAYQKWWERWPGRLEYELERLDALGIPYERDEEVFAEGALVLRLWPTVDGEKIFLVARFPDFYPYTRFEVEAPDLNLPHHQAPFGKNLCLIGLASENWRAADTLADFIRDRLPNVLKAGRSEDKAEASGLEEHQAEPFSVFYSYQQDAMVLIEGGWRIDPEVSAGELVIGIREDANAVLRGAVREVRGEGSRVLARLDPALARLFPKTFRCRWVRLEEPIREEAPDQFWARLRALDPSLSDSTWKNRWTDVKGGRISVAGVLFPEEVGWREKGDGWVFAVRLQVRGQGGEFVYLARAGRAGRSDLAARVPELSGLGGCKVAVIGLGGVGWPSALELARNGVGQLRVLDSDFVEAATTVRWAFGIPAAGVPKANAIKNFLDANYPYTEVVPYIHRVGGVLGGGRSDLEVLNELLDGADLVYDATAEVGIQSLLSDLAAERRLPYICVSTTQGAWGGLVARVRPGRTAGCWRCLQHALTDETIPPPPAAPENEVQPAGCASPTFTGASFDIEEVALCGVRLAASTLLGADGTAYPEADWDVGVVSLREGKGRLLAPRWDTFPLDRHPSCSCGSRAA